MVRIWVGDGSIDRVYDLSKGEEMNRSQKRRLWLIIAISVVASAVVLLSLFVLRNNIDLYFTASELNAAQVSPKQTIKVGGWVKKHSVHYNRSQQVRFALTDHQQTVWVQYTGLLPSLFREGQGIVVSGHRLSSGVIQAQQVLAKHDENYHPPKLVNDKIQEKS